MFQLTISDSQSIANLSVFALHKKGEKHNKKDLRKSHLKINNFDVLLQIIMFGNCVSFQSELFVI